jgi:hypothetical protein
VPKSGVVEYRHTHGIQRLSEQTNIRSDGRVELCKGAGDEMVIIASESESMSFEVCWALPRSPESVDQSVTVAKDTDVPFSMSSGSSR